MPDTRIVELLQEIYTRYGEMPLLYFCGDDPAEEQWIVRDQGYYELYGSRTRPWSRAELPDGEWMLEGDVALRHAGGRMIADGPTPEAALERALAYFTRKQGEDG